MCDPISLAVVAVAATATSVIGQVQGAKAQTKAIQQSLNVKSAQIDDASTAEINDRLREARREQGRITVAAGESGLNLNSGGIETLLMDSATQAGLSNDRSLANRESRRTAADAEAQSMVPSRPTALGAGLQIAFAGANAYGGAAGKAKK